MCLVKRDKIFLFFQIRQSNEHATRDIAFVTSRSCWSSPSGGGLPPSAKSQNIWMKSKSRVALTNKTLVKDDEAKSKGAGSESRRDFDNGRI